MTKVIDGNVGFYQDPTFQAYFKNAPRSLVLKANPPHFTVLAVSDQYLVLTHKERDEVLNKSLFEVFPGNDTDTTQQRSVYTSFMRVVQTKEIDILPLFTYEIDNPQTGKKEMHYWSNVNEPVIDEEGNVVAIINTTANLTVLVAGKNTKNEDNWHKIDISFTNQQNQKLAADNIKYKKLNDELKKTYEREEILIEELSAANENLRALNEELTSSNEHLQLMHDHIVLTILKLTDAEERARLASEAANIGTFSVELESSKFSVSQRTCEIFGIPPGEEVSLETFLVLMTETHRQRVAKSITNSMNLNDTPYFEEYAIVRKNDGAKRWVRALGNKRVMGPDKILIFAGVLIDITEQKENEQLKKDFVNMVGFKLKTLLTFISALLQIFHMNTNSSDDLLARLTEKANEKISSMTEIIDNFLNSFPAQKQQDKVN